MSRYIDADALKEKIGNTAFLKLDDTEVVEQFIDTAPSIDIVRCCECYHFDNDSCYCTIFHGFMDDLGFCYVGDRKTKKDERRAYVKEADDE